MRFTAFGLLVAIQATSAFAQAPPQPPPRREVKAEFALVATSGNASTQSIGTGGEVIYRPTPFVFNAKAAFVRNEAENVETAKSLATLLRGARAMTARLQVYAQHGYLRDRFAGINQRNLVDGGIAYVLAQTARHIVSAEGGLGYLIEDRRTGLNLSTPTGTTGLKYKFQISPTSDFTDDLLASFDFDDNGTWRMNQAASLTARIATAWSLKLSNQIRFVNDPVPGFEQTDSITSAALVLSF
jgi:putative salt-induced outer membrane protein YdiY